MIKTIEERKGKTKLEKKEEKTYIKKCWNCKSKFTYQNEDIKIGVGLPPDITEEVTCPVCYIRNNIIFKKRYRK